MIGKGDLYVALIGLALDGFIVMIVTGTPPTLLIMVAALLVWIVIEKAVYKSYRRLRPIVTRAEPSELSVYDTKALHILFKICPPRNKRAWRWQIERKVEPR
jgi:hypothetical protein